MVKSGRAVVMTVWLGIVAFIYPIPHTIALRNLLLVSGLLLCVSRLFRVGGRPQLLQLSALPHMALVMLLSLTAWMVFQSIFVSRHSVEALQLLRGDWMVALLVAFIGGWVTQQEQEDLQGSVVSGLCVALLAHLAWLLGYQLLFMSATGEFPSLGELTPFAQRDYHSSLLTMLTALLAAELMARLLKGRHLLPFSTGCLGVCLGINLLATVLIQTRNAVLITSGLVLACAVLLVRGRRVLDDRAKRMSGVAVVLAVFVVVGGVLNDVGRWKQFVETAKLAFDTREHLSWQNLEAYPLPRMSNGNPVEVSAYSRIAWAKVAVEQIVKHPLGVGFGHKAFGWAVNDSYGLESGIESSHSGILDFTIANGIPGIALWLAFSVALIRFGLQSFGRNGSPAGLMLALSVFGYFVRCVLDGHLSGWRLEMYGLIVGVLVLVAARGDGRVPGAD